MAISGAAELWQGLLACLSPLRCPGCDAESSPGPGFCPACAPLLEPAPLELQAPAPVAAGFAYGGPMADAIARLKYGGRTDLAPALGQLLASAALPYAGRVDCVIALPLFPRRLHARGFNQSALLARYAADALGVPLDSRVLWRVRDTAVQAGLTRERRISNVRGAFRARPIAARVLLIDDVHTTGATLASAASALEAAGCPEVIALALAAAAG